MWAPRASPPESDEGGEMSLHRLVHRVTGGAQPRFVDDAEADLTGQVGDDRMAPLGGRDQGVEGLAPGVVDRVALRSLLEPALEDVDDHRDLRRDPLLRLVDPVQRLLERRRALEVGHAVVARAPGASAARNGAGSPSPSTSSDRR